MFNSLRDELNKIALMESDNELDDLDEMEISDNGAADDELVDDVDEEYEEMEDDVADEVESGSGFASPSDIDSIVEAFILAESPCAVCGGINCTCNEDDYDDDDEDSIDYDEGVIGDGDDDMLYDDDDEEDSMSGDIDGTTNSINLNEDLYEDDEEELDDLLEGMLGCDDEFSCGNIYANKQEIFGDSSDMPEGDVPPAPQYEKMMKRRGASGREFVDFGNSNYDKYGKVFLDKSLLASATVDDDDYDEEGNDYDFYASAGNIYDDDENEEFYGIRGEVATKNLFGRHSINNINAAKLKDRYGDDPEGALDESVSAFLANYMD